MLIGGDTNGAQATAVPRKVLVVDECQFALLMMREVGAVRASSAALAAAAGVLTIGSIRSFEADHSLTIAVLDRVRALVRISDVLSKTLATLPITGVRHSDGRTLLQPCASSFPTPSAGGCVLAPHHLCVGCARMVM